MKHIRLKVSWLYWGTLYKKYSFLFKYLYFSCFSFKIISFLNYYIIITYLNFLKFFMYRKHLHTIPVPIFEVPLWTRVVRPITPNKSAKKNNNRFFYNFFSDFFFKFFIKNFLSDLKKNLLLFFFGRFIKSYFSYKSPKKLN